MTERTERAIDAIIQALPMPAPMKPGAHALLTELVGAVLAEAYRDAFAAATRSRPERTES